MHYTLVILHIIFIKNVFHYFAFCKSVSLYLKCVSLKLLKLTIYIYVNYTNIYSVWQCLFLIGIFSLSTLSVIINILCLRSKILFVLYLEQILHICFFSSLFLLSNWLLSIIISTSTLYWITNLLVFYCLVLSPEFIRNCKFVI